MNSDNDRTNTKLVVGNGKPDARWAKNARPIDINGDDELWKDAKETNMINQLEEQDACSEPDERGRVVPHGEGYILVVSGASIEDLDGDDTVISYYVVPTKPDMTGVFVEQTIKEHAALRAAQAREIHPERYSSRFQITEADISGFNAALARGIQREANQREISTLEKAIRVELAKTDPSDAYAFGRGAELAREARKGSGAVLLLVVSNARRSSVDAIKGAATADESTWQLAVDCGLVAAQEDGAEVVVLPANALTEVELCDDEIVTYRTVEGDNDALAAWRKAA